MKRLIRFLTGENLRKLERRLARVESKIDRLESFSHGARATYVGDNRVLVRVVMGDDILIFFLEADDMLLAPWIIARGDYEPELANFFYGAVRPDSHCLDIGANFGFHACLMARRAHEGRVIAVEADRKVADLARDNLLVNHLFSGSAMHAAVADREGELTLHRRHRRSGNTSLGRYGEAFTETVGEAPEQAFQVRATTIDALAETMGGRVDFIKIDVEGAEPLVIRGARRCIADNPDLVIVMEWSPGQIRLAGFEVAAFIDELRALEFSAALIESEGTRELSWDEVAALPYAGGLALRRRFRAPPPASAPATPAPR